MVIYTYVIVSFVACSSFGLSMCSHTYTLTKLCLFKLQGFTPEVICIGCFGCCFTSLSLPVLYGCV